MLQVKQHGTSGGPSRCRWVGSYPLSVSSLVPFLTTEPQFINKNQLIKFIVFLWCQLTPHPFKWVHLVSNIGALALYGRLGFIRAKQLHHYYLDGMDAFWLKLLFPRPQTMIIPKKSNRGPPRVSVGPANSVRNSLTSVLN